jgi:hypothetical protein
MVLLGEMVVEGWGAQGGRPRGKKGDKKPPSPEEAWEQAKRPGIGFQEMPKL